MNPFADNEKNSALIDRHLMGEKTSKDPIGEIWCSLNEEKEVIIVKVNPKVCDKLGYTSYELVGKKVTELMTREETVRIHIDKYFASAFASTKTIIMRHHGQGFEIGTQDGRVLKVALAVIFAKENEALQGKRMIPRTPEKPFVFGCLRIIFLDDFEGVLKATE